MFASKYSNYSSEYIIDDEYEKLCSILLSKAKDKATEEKMRRNTL